jgi:hypothetical protein
MMKSHPRYNTARCWAQTAFVYKKAGTCWTRCVLQWREKKKSWYLNVRWRDRWFMMQDDGQRYQTPRQYVAHGRCSFLYNKWTKGTLLAAVERMFCLVLARATYNKRERHIWKRLRHGYCHKIYDLSVGGPFVSCVRSALIRVGREKKIVDVDESGMIVCSTCTVAQIWALRRRESERYKGITISSLTCVAVDGPSAWVVSFFQYLCSSRPLKKNSFFG